MNSPLPGRSEPTYALIAGGGTGGHVNPAIAIADALVQRGRVGESIHFVGSRRGLEAKLVPAAGYAITLLPGRGIKRKLTLGNISAVSGLMVGLARSFVLLLRLRPRIVVSVGGYAAAPAAFAAVVLRVPIVVAEANAVPGAVNRLVARVAKASAVALPGTALPRAVVTGNPVRPAIAALDRSPLARAEARRVLGLPEGRLIVGAFGGSLGATTINRSVFELAERWRDRHDVAIHHAIGRRDWADASLRPLDVEGSPLYYRAVEYEDRMDALLAASDVVISRAGATTVAELAAVGLPSVLVPFPGATADHQTANAKTLEAGGAAVAIADSACDGAMLSNVLSPLLAQPQLLQSMATAAQGFAQADAADSVAALIEEHARP